MAPVAKRRVLFVSSMSGPAWGGSEELWSRAATRLAHDGQSVYAEIPNVSNRPNHPRIHWLKKSGVIVNWWPVPTVRNRVKQLITDRVRVRLKIAARDDAAWFKHRVDEQKPHLTVFSSGSNEFPAHLIAACRERKIPYVLISQAIHECNWPSDRTADEMRGYFAGAAAAFFVCRANLESTRLQTCLDGKNFHVTRNPFNVPWDVTIPWPDNSAKLQAAVVARLEPATKGCDLLLECLAKPGWRERSLEINFYGTGNSETGVCRMAKFLGLTNCHFHGQVEDIVEIWRKNHLLVLPSRYEGLPLVVVEAMLCGRPCVVTDVGGSAELPEEGITGFIADGPTVRCLAPALERAWAQRGRWREMGEAAARAVRINFPPDPVGILVERLYELL